MHDVIGANPLPLEAQAKLNLFVDWLDNNYEIDNGATALYWALSYQLATMVKKSEEVE